MGEIERNKERQTEIGSEPNTIVNLILCMLKKIISILTLVQFSGKGRQSLH